MGLKWTDVSDIVVDLDEAHPDVEPSKVNFVDLMHWVLELPDFRDTRERCGEKILEAIQMMWIEERED